MSTSSQAKALAQAVAVRMRGFASRRALSEALAWVDAHASALSGEPVAVESVAGRVLSTALVAPIAVPEFDRAAMDGYAIRGAETRDAGDRRVFPVVGTSMPGRPYDGVVPAGSVVRIMTGSPMPVGSDAVVPVEYTTETPEGILIDRSVTPGQHFGRVGEDIASGSPALPAGRRIRPQDAGLAASLGLARLEVVRRPRIRLIVTGNEVRPPGSVKGPYEIFDANSVTLRGLVARDGGVIESHRRLGDDTAEIAEALSAPGADVILVSGGSSVGTEDHAPRLVGALGTLAIHGIAMRPASPAGMGQVGAALVFLLPGNPVACLCAYDFFAGRAIRRLGGLPPDWPYRQVRAALAHPIVSETGRVDYFRVRFTDDGVEPIALSGASMLSSTTRADGFIVVPADSAGWSAGVDVTVHCYE